MTELPIRVLVTGAAGQFGQWLVAHLRSLGVPVTALVMSTSDEVPADRIVVGDARSPEAVAEALIGADAVIHLAAIPTPDLGPDEVVFGLNTQATFVVLNTAARAGVRRAVIASSFSATGLPFSPVPAEPAYVPVDEDLPSRVADPYALSKQVDELTAAMIWRRYAMSVVALRLPFLGEADGRLAARHAVLTERPEAGRADLWTYLDYRDAARACVAGLCAPRGVHVIGVAAPVTLSPYPTSALLDRYLPDVPRRRGFPGRTSLVDTSRAEDLLRFRAEHILPVHERELS